MRLSSVDEDLEMTFTRRSEDPLRPTENGVKKPSSNSFPRLQEDILLTTNKLQVCMCVYNCIYIYTEIVQLYILYIHKKNLCMHACMYACVHVCMYVSVYLRIGVSMYLCIYVKEKWKWKDDTKIPIWHVWGETARSGLSCEALWWQRVHPTEGTVTLKNVAL